MAFAVGKHSNALCDRCGFEYPYLSLRTEWNNLKVCSECFETKHPQLQPPRQPVDPEALYQPRPQNGVETTAFQVVTTNGLTYLGDGFWSTATEAQLPTELQSFSATGSVGSVTVTTT